jgi:hypothetical protein
VKTTTTRIFRPERPTRGDTNVTPQQPIDEASWIWRSGADHWGGAVFSETRSTPETLARVPQTFLRFRRDFESVAGEDALELDVSADERFILLLDGEEIGRGPHRGLPNRWHCHAYRVENLAPGAHRLEAICWQIGEHAPLAQLSIRGGFVLKASSGGASRPGEPDPYDAALTTGKAPWRVAPLSGTRMTDKGSSGAFGVGSQCEVRGTSLLDEMPPDSAWEDAVVVRGPVKTWAGLRIQGWLLFPTPLPDMMRERKTPGRLVGDSGAEPPFVVPPNTRRTLFWDLGNYFCAYPEMRVSGGAGARVRWGWAECLTGPDGRKRDRAAWEGLDMPKPFEDAFLPDGRDGARFTTPWWRCGRWCRLVVETADEPLRIDSLALVETRLPAALQARFEGAPAAPGSPDGQTVSPDGQTVFGQIQPVCERSLQMCMHETFFDCPYYEQQMYPGDSRVQYLVSGLLDTEDRTVRNAIALYDTDRRDNGQIPMNCPTRGTQESFPFSCCEAMMFGDYAWNHDNKANLLARLPGLNHTLLGMALFERPDGLLGRTPGWNFIDWVPEWPNGVPPDGDSDLPNAEINLEYLHAILSAAIAEEAVGETALAAHWRAKADRLRAAIRAAFWCPDQALFSSALAHDSFSQHSQALALLADVLPDPADAERCFAALVAAPLRGSVAESPATHGGSVAEPPASNGGSGAESPTVWPLSRGSIYFRHYLFATYFKFHRPDLFFAGLDFWRDCLDWHCSTILEIPDTNSRSDCHGWGSHPLWHLHTGVAGVRSAAPFYASVLVEPQPGHLRHLRSRTPTPRGDVALDLAFDGAGGVSGTVTLPAGLSGTFRWRGSDRPLAPGRNNIAPL